QGGSRAVLLLLEAVLSPEAPPRLLVLAGRGVGLRSHTALGRAAPIRGKRRTAVEGPLGLVRHRRVCHRRGSRHRVQLRPLAAGGAPARPVTWAFGGLGWRAIG